MLNLKSYIDSYKYPIYLVFIKFKTLLNLFPKIAFISLILF